MTQSSQELLAVALRDWSVAFNRKISERAIEWWFSIFGKEPVRRLAKAIELVTREAERMPAPGNLTKALKQIANEEPTPPSTQYRYQRIVAKDSETGEDVDAIVYDKEPGVVCFRAVDCPDGREFLNLLSAWNGRQQPFPTLPSSAEARRERNRQKAEWKKRVLG